MQEDDPRAPFFFSVGELGKPSKARPCMASDLEGAKKEAKALASSLPVGASVFIIERVVRAGFTHDADGVTDTDDA